MKLNLFLTFTLIFLVSCSSMQKKQEVAPELVIEQTADEKTKSKQNLESRPISKCENMAILLKGIANTNPIEDAKRNIQNNDYKFRAIGGKIIWMPGIPKIPSIPYYKRYNINLSISNKSNQYEGSLW